MYGHCAFVHLLGQSFLVFYNQCQAITTSGGITINGRHLQSVVG